MIQNLSILKIEWRDACSVSESGIEWLTKDEILKKAHEMYNEACISIGFQVGETDDYILLAGTQYDKGQSFTDISLIPKKMIVNKKKL